MEACLWDWGVESVRLHRGAELTPCLLDAEGDYVLYAESAWLGLEEQKAAISLCAEAPRLLKALESVLDALSLTDSHLRESKVVQEAHNVMSRAKMPFDAKLKEAQGA